MLTEYAGHLAALSTACLWAFTSVFFNAAARRIGAPGLNAFRLWAAVVLLGTTHLLRTGDWWPEAVSGQVMWLALSGLVGLTLGDQALFQAFLDIGPRLALLVMTTAPIFAAILGWVVLGESLAWRALLGMAITIGGIAWVVLERPAGAPGAPLSGADAHAARVRLVRGVAMAVLGALGQAGGLMMSKLGIGHGWLPPEERLDPQAATLIRMVFAALAALPMLMLLRATVGRRGPDDPRLSGRQLAAGLGLAACGAVTGPFLGVWMSLVASDLAPLGVAQTLMSLTPVTILPFSIWLYRERLTARSVGGALLAIMGASLLF